MKFSIHVLNLICCTSETHGGGEKLQIFHPQPHGNNWLKKKKNTCQCSKSCLENSSETLIITQLPVRNRRFTGNSESVVTFRPESHELTSSRPCWAVLSSVYPPFVSLLRSQSHFICRLLHCITNEKRSPSDKAAHVEPKRRVCWAARRAGVGGAAAGSSLSPWLLFVWPKLRASRTNDPLGFTESIWPAAGCTEASPTF